MAVTPQRSAADKIGKHTRATRRLDVEQSCRLHERQVQPRHFVELGADAGAQTVFVSTAGGVRVDR